MRLHRTSAAIAVAAATALSLTACDGEGAADSAPAGASASAIPDTGASRDGGTESPSAAESTEATGGGDTQASASGAPRVGDGTCRTSDLSFSSSGGMAEGEVLINLKNTGSAACSMRGFPGLDLEGKDGTVSAERSDRSAPTVTLAPGEGTNFSLHFPPGTGDGSGVTFTSALVTPPNETHAHRMSLAVGVPVDAGTAHRITVDPVGSGK
ncbi:DUF4232 domain-containing protein [Streptomyces sp. NPDC006516]|uniref:DUF4232 domain-containing protein n=1 Tax=Streptomyces sp. NPDC006516 TaxID=3154309 RepID=UPI0033AD9EAF